MEVPLVLVGLGEVRNWEKLQVDAILRRTIVVGYRLSRLSEVAGIHVAVASGLRR